MNDVVEVEFTETVNTKSRVSHIYKVLFTLQAVSLLIIYTAAQGWLN